MEHLKSLISKLRRLEKQLEEIINFIEKEVPGLLSEGIKKIVLVNSER